MSSPMVNVVIPTIGKERMIVDLLESITIQDEDIVRSVTIYDNGMTDDVRAICRMFKVEIVDAIGSNIYSMWNRGVQESLRANPTDYIAILNDDILLNCHGFFTKLVEPLDMHDEVWATCGNYDPFGRHSYDSTNDYMKEVTGTFKDGGFAGFCFAVSGTAYSRGLSFFDETYNWWYGDDDFVHSIHKSDKKTVISLQAHMIHVNGGSQSVKQYTSEFNLMVDKDRVHYFEKWHS